MTLLDNLDRIPRPVLILIIMSIGLAFIMYKNPLADGCEIEVKNFGRQIVGVLRPYQDSKGRKQYPVISPQKQTCRDQNSNGGCENYFLSLKKLADNAIRVTPECAPKLTESYPNLLSEAADAVKIMALIAWGPVPPKDGSMRIGWLGQAEVYTFCRLKRLLQDNVTDEEYKAFRTEVYKNYPQDFPEGIDADKKLTMERPKALKTVSNPDGTLTEEEVFERSLFSIRCDLYY